MITYIRELPILHLLLCTDEKGSLKGGDSLRTVREIHIRMYCLLRECVLSFVLCTHCATHVSMNLCEYTTVCHNGGTCHFNDQMLECECSEGFSGARCQLDWSSMNESERGDETDMEYIESSGVYQTSDGYKMETSVINLVANISLLHVTCTAINRTGNNCPQHFPCKHGVCIRSEYDSSQRNIPGSSSTTITCTCDLGWTSYSCDTCCDVECGNHGNCVVRDNIKQCQCDWGHKGTKCGHKHSSIPGRAF